MKRLECSDSQEAAIYVRNRCCDSEKDIFDRMHYYFPWYKANKATIMKLSEAKSPAGLENLRKFVRREQKCDR